MTKRKEAPEPKASGIQIETQTLTTVKTTDGLPIRKGDTILLKVRDETILCTFTEISGSGYFVTSPFDGSGAEVKYRISSIAACFRIDKVEYAKGEQAPENNEEY